MSIRDRFPEAFTPEAEQRRVEERAAGSKAYDEASAAYAAAEAAALAQPPRTLPMPGPWVWDADGWLSGPAGDVISYAGCSSHAADVEPADAALIAAAPELLAACEACRVAFLALPDGWGEAMPASLTPTIQKARGQK